MKIDGRRHCGQIEFEAEANPAALRICHCMDCQTLRDGAPPRRSSPEMDRVDFSVFFFLENTIRGMVFFWLFRSPPIRSDGCGLSSPFWIF